MMKIFKYFLFAVLFLNLYSEVHVQAKPIPPGSGEGDVPANILILLDSSASMRNKIIAGDGIENPGDVVETGDGNLIIGEGRLGFAKILKSFFLFSKILLFSSIISGITILIKVFFFVVVLLIFLRSFGSFER